MSLILITNHNESIYNITKSHGPPVHKKPTQIPTTDTKTTTSAVKRPRLPKRVFPKNSKPHGTMGLPKQPPRDPHDFLKKGTGKPPMIPQESKDEEIVKHILPPISNKRYSPPVPARDEVLKDTANKIVRKHKNFLAENIKKATTMAPKIPAQKVVITNDGITRELTCGLEPQHLTSDVYGKIPPYLDNLIKIKQQAMEREKDKHGVTQAKCIYITREERDHLLAGLKENWEELQRVYQGLPILTDTIPKILRKSKMEQELKQLEKDIVLIERHPYIYVYDDENDL